jgi:hypothetical protein
MGVRHDEVLGAESGRSWKLPGEVARRPGVADRRQRARTLRVRHVGSGVPHHIRPAIGEMVLAGTDTVVDDLGKPESRERRGAAELTTCSVPPHYRAVALDVQARDLSPGESARAAKASRERDAPCGAHRAGRILSRGAAVGVDRDRLRTYGPSHERAAHHTVLRRSLAGRRWGKAEEHQDAQPRHPTTHPHHVPAPFASRHRSRRTSRVLPRCHRDQAVPLSAQVGGGSPRETLASEDRHVGRLTRIWKPGFGCRRGAVGLPVSGLRWLPWAG